MAQKDVGNKVPIYKLKKTKEVMDFYDEWGLNNKYDKDMVDWNYTGPKETSEVFAKYQKEKNIKIYDAGCGTGLVGLELKKYGFITSIYRGTYETYNLSAKILSYLGKLIAGRESIDQMGGPIKIIQISGEISNYGIIPLLALIAAISVNLGIINLLPIPVLDGGHLLYYSLEVVRGKPLSQKTQEIGMQIGMSLLIALMIFVTFLDISRL